MAKVTSISPSSAKYTGGEQVVVSGSGFTGATEVYFEDANYRKHPAQFTVNSDAQITVTCPAMERARKTHLFVIVGGKESTIRQVPSLQPDGDGLSSTGTQGVNWSTGPSRDNEFHFTWRTREEDEAYLNQMMESSMPQQMPDW
ncbi:IPT/TIG domain-containing protein [Nocardia sp. NBC_01009]|uniref:IPT/TIG domain-containing protein n=1 Tax=Nocardia sp. NBC_01009 TaxID=2975996 RepID=UPI00386DB693|nr:IPT/TIG domain-containing protein [Nocardia sp. NBC_01009]